MWKDWQEWHEFMTHLGATTTIDDRRFLLEGGCPKCGCKSWEVTTDGWAYCNKCAYGQCQTFDVTERPEVYDICPEHPYGCPSTKCRNLAK